MTRRTWWPTRLVAKGCRWTLTVVWLLCAVSQMVGAAGPHRGMSPPVDGYGNYFVLALRFVNAAGSGDVLALAWERDEQGWRIYSFKIMQS